MVLQPFALAMVALGVLIGILMGSIPGMTATMTVAVLVSFTFSMQPTEGMMLLLGVYSGAIYAGSIPAILIRTPGTPSAAATLIDGYPLSQKGKAGQAIGIATVASVLGGIISGGLLILIAPQIATFALEFRSPEFFALTIWGLTIIANVSSDSLTKGLISGCIGMFLATVGRDPVNGSTRFTFDMLELIGGIDFIAVMIGMFGISEVLVRFTRGIDAHEVDQRLSGILPTRDDLRSIARTTTVSSLIGTFIGALPGAGGAISSFITYNEAKRGGADEDEEAFGSGNIRGVAAAESGNNSSTGGALIPTLTLGIPGDSVTAVMIGALLVHNIQPGPGLFEDNPEIVYAIFAAFMISYVVVLVLGLVGARYWARIINLPQGYLWPIIVVMCVVGTIAIQGVFFDVWLMLLAGLLGFSMRMDDYPLAPLVLGMILAPIAETNFRRSLQLSEGSIDIFLTSPIAFAILALSVISVILPTLLPRIRKINLN